MKDRSKIGCLVLVLLGVSLSVLGYYVLIFSPRGRADRAYEALDIGQTREEVVRLFGRAPDYSCFYHSSEIVYFFRGWNTLYVGGKALYKEVHGKRVNLQPEDMPFRIATKKEIPYVYDAYQILIGQDGLVKAGTHNGETNLIRTVRGDIKGDHFSVLDESFFSEETVPTSTGGAMVTVANEKQGEMGG